MPRKHYSKNCRNIKSSDEKEKMVNIQQERKCLREILEERNMYQPRMRLQEMRDLCSAVEKSEQEYSATNQFPIFTDEFSMLSTEMLSFHQDFLRQCEYQHSLQDTEPPEELFRIEKDTFDEFPLPLTSSSSDFFSSIKQSSLEDISMLSITEKSTPKCACVREQIDTMLPEVLSDEESWYSPGIPGPCCKVEVVTHAEIHPVPSNIEFRNDYSAAVKKQRFSGIEKRTKIEWDLIEELV
ncbi:uncharacterized protein LOC129725943 [Wyeomyia smithii]|uniref:uncharacterized protein LOC129725943 n=1 Tax=Wyeomyia smithii TaxID=174621 RepID=UPI002467D7CA|nr:uncharacterized protein LOC129725943 [Wyeomyia smithii]